MMTEFVVRESRFAIRMLLRRPVFTVIVAATLALGIGANTALFSLVDAVLLRPLPFPHPDELVLVSDDLTGRQLKNVGMSVLELQDFQQRAGVFEEISAVWPVDANLTGSDRPERIELLGVSPNYFSLLGASAQLGRVFGPEDNAKGFNEGIVISDSAWHRLFGGDPNVLGRQVRVDSDLYVVIGVMPPGFRHPGRTLRDQVDFWASAGFAANPFGPPDRVRRMLPGAIGRLKRGLSVTQAQSQVNTFVSALSEEFPNEYPAEAGWKVKLTPASENLVAGVRTLLIVLLAAVGVVLLVGCVNIANLMLARSLGRQREMAIRLALGAGRWRLIAQLLSESLMLALLGGGIALLIASWTTELLLRFVPATIPRLNEVGFSGSVLSFTLLTSIATGLLFGLVPALQASRPDMLTSLKEGSAGAGVGRRSHRVRNVLVVAEFALSLVLMIGAGLLLRSFWRLIEVNPGFNPENVLVARIWLPVPNNPELDPYRPPAKRSQFVKDVLQRAKALPGVKYAAVGSGGGVPLIRPHNTASFTIEDQADEAVPPLVQPSAVSPDYFYAFGTPLIEGRFFAESDDVDAPRVALVDQATAARFWPDESPIGKHIKLSRRAAGAPWLSIVGVVGNMKTDGFEVPDQPHVYVPILQNPSYAMAVYLKTMGDPRGLTNALREQVQAVDPDLPLFGDQSMEDLVSTSLAERKFAMQLLIGFGAVALLLAGIGIYGVMAYSVNQRTREIGIRLALGADASDIIGWVIKQGMWLTLSGVVIGLLSALALTRLLSGFLFGVAPTDPLTFAALAALLVLVSLFACYVPARRATRVDPIVALRYE